MTVPAFKRLLISLMLDTKAKKPVIPVIEIQQPLSLPVMPAATPPEHTLLYCRFFKHDPVPVFNPLPAGKHTKNVAPGTLKTPQNIIKSYVSFSPQGRLPTLANNKQGASATFTYT